MFSLISKVGEIFKPFELSDNSEYSDKADSGLSLNLDI